MREHVRFLRYLYAGVGIDIGIAAGATEGQGRFIIAIPRTIHDWLDRQKKAN